MPPLDPIAGPGFLPTSDMVNHPDSAVRASQVANLRSWLLWAQSIINQVVASGNVLELGGDVLEERTYGLASSVGTNSFAAREDHTHGSPSLSDVVPLPVGAASLPGAAVTPSRNDHVHQLTVFEQIPAGTIDGVNATFTLTATPLFLVLDLNGNVLTGGGEDYTRTGATIVYVAGKIPQPATSDHSADKHFARYIA